MDPLERILVGVHFEETSDEAIRQATEWAEAFGSELIACHVVPGAAADDPAESARLTELVRARVSAVTGRSAAGMRVMIDSGTPHAMVVSAAEECLAGLVVIGAPAAWSYEHLLAGSTTERIVRYSATTTLIARARRPAAERTRVVLAATDLSDPSLPAILAADSFARSRQARLSVLHVVDPRAVPPALLPSPGGGLAELQGLLSDLGVVGEARVLAGGAVDTILRTVRDVEPDLLVIGTRGRTGLKRILVGSTAEAVVRAAPCPTLVVRLRETWPVPDGV